MENVYNIRYSTGFKRQVVEEVESGKYSSFKAQKVYGIGGNTTIKKWIKSMNSSEKSSKKVVVQTEAEVQAFSDLKKRTRQLEKLLADKEFELKAFKILAEECQLRLDAETKKKCIAQLSEEVRRYLGKE